MSNMKENISNQKETKLSYTLVMLLIGIFFLIPAIGVFLTSFRTDTEISLHGVWAISGNVTLDNYFGKGFAFNVKFFVCLAIRY